MPKESLYNAITEPNSGVAAGYEEYTVQFKDGARVFGTIISETSEELLLRLPGNSFLFTISKEQFF